MASTRIQQAQLVLSTAFQQQVMGSLLALASYVITTESANAANHANRLAYADAIIAGPFSIAQYMAPGLMSQTVIVNDAANTAVGASGTVVPDADCDAAVQAVFNFYANQYAARINFGPGLF